MRRAHTKLVCWLMESVARLGTSADAHDCTAFLLLLLHAANAGRLHLITNKRAGLLDPGTGLLQLDALTLPKTHNKSCAWDLLRGTAGQSSAVFYQNSSLFAVAQQLCNYTTSSGKKESSIIGTHILAFFANGAGACSTGKARIT